MAGLLLLAALPLIGLAAVVAVMLSGSSPFVAHRRVGQCGSRLWMWKLRTMWPSTGGRGFRWVEYIDDEQGPSRKASGDARVAHWFARFCRRHSIDELPQLMHVLRGQMSIIGPRPLTQQELAAYYGDDAREVVQVKPGITGMWQAHGRNKLTYAERRKLDLYFVRHRSRSLDASILWRTIVAVLTGRNAW
ncbi:MAG: sugar transferase [Acidobacteria bacterium]|nr:sugar transferase [Acidobacteriota bacterium]